MSITKNSYPGGLRVRTTLIIDESTYTLDLSDYYIIVEGTTACNISLNPSIMGQEFCIRNASTKNTILSVNNCYINNKSSFILYSEESIWIVFDGTDYEVMSRNNGSENVKINGDTMIGTLYLPSLGFSGNSISLLSNISGNISAQFSNIYGNSIYQNSVKVVSTSTSPLVISGGNISILNSSSMQDGYISSSDWIKFNTVSEKVSKSGDTIDGTIYLNNISNNNSNFNLIASGNSNSINIISKANGTNGGNIKIQAIEGSLNASNILLLANSPNSGVGGNIITNANIISSGNNVSLGNSTNAWNAIYGNSIYDNNIRVVTSINGNNGPNVTLTTSNISEGTNQYFTATKVKAVISGSSPISVSNGLISIQQSTNEQNGYISSTDWNIFNNKQDKITVYNSGTGINVANYSNNNLIFNTVTGVGSVTASLYNGNIIISGNAIQSPISMPSNPTVNSITTFSGPTGFNDTDITIISNSINIPSGGSITAPSGNFNYINNKAISIEKCNEIPSGVINGSNTSFTLIYTPVLNSIKLYKNGLYMIPYSAGGTFWDYIVSGSTIIYTNAPLSGSNHICNYNFVG